MNAPRRSSPRRRRRAPRRTGGMQWLGRANWLPPWRTLARWVLTALTQPTPGGSREGDRQDPRLTDKPFGVNLTILRRSPAAV